MILQVGAPFLINEQTDNDVCFVDLSQEKELDVGLVQAVVLGRN